MKKYPSGRKGGTEQVWNFRKSYDSNTLIPGMPELKKYAGKKNRKPH